MRITRKILTTILTAAAMAGAANAHHALEFIEIESYSTPRQGESVFYLQYDYKVGNKNDPSLDRWEITPGFSYGIIDRLMLDIHTHFAKFNLGRIEEERQEEFEPYGPSPFIEAVSLSLQYRLTEGMPVDVALGASWEIPFSRAKNLLGSDYVYEGTLILSREFGEHGLLCANFSYEHEGSDGEWGWGAGIKYPISADPHGISAGMEIMGDFEGNSWSVLPGIYLPIGSSAIFKTGIEFGWERNGEENKWEDSLRASVSLMHSF